LREERRLRVFYSRAMRNIHGRMKDEVRVEWRRLHNEELRDMYSLPNIIRVIESRGIKKETIRPTRRCEGNIKVDLK
jgi:hypothetical protein